MWILLLEWVKDLATDVGVCVSIDVSGCRYWCWNGYRIRCRFRCQYIDVSIDSDVEMSRG